MSIRRTCVILTMFLGALPGCDRAAADTSARSRPKCLASATLQKAFGDLAPVGKVKKMKAMLEEDATLVHAVINGKLDERHFIGPPCGDNWIPSRCSSRRGPRSTLRPLRK